jgi:hypothetical protein
MSILIDKTTRVVTQGMGGLTLTSATDFSDAAK